MNFLAHLYLSGNSEDIKIGNFIGDWVKGNVAKQTQYNANIIKGLSLHRRIDWYADTHPVFKQSSARLKPKFFRYSDIITDVFYDHFLASLWTEYSDVSLNRFSKDAYRILLKNYAILPSEVKQFLPFMIASNRLHSYSTISGIRKALSIMTRFSPLPATANDAVIILHQNYNEFTAEFRSFFPTIIEYVKSEHEITF